MFEVDILGMPSFAAAEKPPLEGGKKSPLLFPSLAEESSDPPVTGHGEDIRLRSHKEGIQFKFVLR